MADEILARLTTIESRQADAAAQRAADTATILAAVDSVAARLTALTEDAEDTLHDLMVAYVALRRRAADTAEDPDVAAAMTADLEDELNAVRHQIAERRVRRAT